MANPHDQLRLVYRRGRLKAGASFFVFACLFIAILAWRFLGLPALGGEENAATFMLVLNIALPITGVLALWGAYEFTASLLSRDPNMVADQNGITLLSGDDVIGPFAWNELSGVSVKTLLGRRRVLALTLRYPEISMERFPSSIRRYRKFLSHQDDLVLPTALFDAPVEQVAHDLEAMRKLYATNRY